MLNELRKSIYNASKTINNLNGRVFYSQAPKDAILPYVTYHFINGRLDKDSINKYENVIVQFNAFDDNVTPDRLETIIEDIEKIFDDGQKTITISGNCIFIDIKRQWVRPIQKIDDVWQAVLQYRFEIQVLEK